MNHINITHIITGLSIGGAEKVLVRLLSEMDRNDFNNQVISLTNLGPLCNELTNRGIDVTAAGFVKGGYNISPITQLPALIKRQSPHLVQTWMYHADLIGGITARLISSAPILWNLRQSTLNEQYSKKSTINTAKACARLSNVIPNTIVCGSEAARVIHAELGYDATKMVVLQNGFDTNNFDRSKADRSAFRQKLGLSEDAVVVGNPSRFDPQKDHQTFFDAAEQVAQECPNAHFVLCGESMVADNTQVMAWIKERNLTDRVKLLGLLDDMTDYYASMDIIALSSAYGEGAPNVLGEAMAMEVPCVATDIGDSAYIVNDCGVIVPPCDAKAFAEGLKTLIRESREENHNRGRRARLYIQKTYPLNTMVKRYQDLYRRIYSQYYDF